MPILPSTGALILISCRLAVRVASLSIALSITRCCLLSSVVPTIKTTSVLLSKPLTTVPSKFRNLHSNE